MWSEVAFILVLILTSVGWAENDRSYEFDSCVNGSVRSFEFAKEVIEESAYCFDKSREFFVSEDCEKKESVKETAKTPQESRREGLGSLETSSCEAFRKMENKLPFAWSACLAHRARRLLRFAKSLAVI